jgi:hypothetical protein
MSKAPEQIEREIAEYLALGGRVVPTSSGSGQASTPRQRAAAQPSLTKDTLLELPGAGGVSFTLTLRPAKVTLAPVPGRRALRTARLAKRAEDTWLVRAKFGRYVGLLEKWTGVEPWAVANLAEQPSSLDAGVRVNDFLLTGETWQDALAEGVRIWWASKV